MIRRNKLVLGCVHLYLQNFLIAIDFMYFGIYQIGLSEESKSTIIIFKHY